MALMIPCILPADTKSPGEIELYRRLKKDSETKDWLVFHSLEVAKHQTKLKGEIDFLIIVPEQGVLALEVKAHRRVVRQDGLWFFGNSQVPETRSPFTQVEESMHSLRERLCSMDTRLKPVPFFHAVIFTHCNFEERSAEWAPWQCISSKRYRFYGIGKAIKEVFRAARKHLTETPSAGWFRTNSCSPDNAQMKLLSQYLRPDFEVLESPQERHKQQVNQVRRYTEEQFRALDSLSCCERILFTGPAGTGKTILAMESARRAAQEGLSVLFLCYNNRLSKWLKREMEPLKEQVTVRTLHAHMLSITNLSPQNKSADFWETELPESAWESLADSHSESSRYDLLVVDEAQDLIKDAWLLVMDELLKGGLSTGRWNIFGDFEGQSIFSSVQDFEVLTGKLLSFSASAVRYQLSINCRNNKPTTEHAIRIGNLGNIYSQILRTDNEAIRPQYKRFNSIEDQANQVASCLTHLLEQGYSCDDIVILSPLRDERSVAYFVQEHKLATVAPLDKRNSKQIGYTSIHAFKGLEASVVFITDIDDLLKSESRKLLYTATTRPIETFYIFLSPDAAEQISTLLME